MEETTGIKIDKTKGIIFCLIGGGFYAALTVFYRKVDGKLNGL